MLFKSKFEGPSLKKGECTFEQRLNVTMNSSFPWFLDPALFFNLSNREPFLCFTRILNTEKILDTNQQLFCYQPVNVIQFRSSKNTVLYVTGSLLILFNSVQLRILNYNWQVPEYSAEDEAFGDQHQFVAVAAHHRVHHGCPARGPRARVSGRRHRSALPEPRDALLVHRHCKVGHRSSHALECQGLPHMTNQVV